MRLDRLFDNNSKILAEANDTGLPLEPSRYPSIAKHQVADFKAPVDIESVIDRLQAMAFKYPIDENPPNYNEAVSALRSSQDAFRQLMHQLQLNPISGLRGHHEFAKRSSDANKATSQHRELQRSGPSPYIVVAGDVDNMAYLNKMLGHEGTNKVLSDVGNLFNKFLGRIENVKMYHPHGDEFAVIAYVDGLDGDSARMRLVEIVRGCMLLSDTLASTGYYVKGWEDTRRVQPTISFGVSTTYKSADGCLTHVKTGASGGKPMKYTLTLDRDLRFELGMTNEQMSAYVSKLAASSPQGFEISSCDGSQGDDVSVVENKMPMENARGKEGVVVLECSYDEMTPQRKDELSRIRQAKTAYMRNNNPPGAIRITEGVYAPLKEGFVGPQ